ncbi:hypothetical protein NQ317_016063 [Molorchus minor]|uniref:Uncharacterized protein n=1 Tax=Molorchus minor TaxID=1323400 RepID=A0ABQ9JE60_9CUCU|nr:hypothetical protein NQ317_016063 [Molorchus minor]
MSFRHIAFRNACEYGDKNSEIMLPKNYLSGKDIKWVAVRLLAVLHAAEGVACHVAIRVYTCPVYYLAAPVVRHAVPRAVPLVVHLSVVKCHCCVMLEVCYSIAVVQVK